ncbi:zinc-ribbon domain-containing protein [Novipirellula artificiosorum]|uniref:Tellurite resistance protein TerB n=1 Tax=Novipirellula artificiosorum TaxID=2528016 RepID=A0A5C6E4D3_9BACT|nr:zinc-ribbon domain-containing protein [Novipirellula artificiosorum]TWU42079.1 Tellurite resistance protein TerB [Novipirellula artificiosorum]
MIIWGSRGLTSTVEATQFHCPQCSTMRSGSLKQVRNFFTLYFIPLIPLNVAGRFVECSSCGGTFAEEILAYDPEQEQQQTNQHLLRVMVMAALADDIVDDAERAEIKKQYMEIAGLPIPAETLDNEIAMATESAADLNTYVGKIAETLSPHGKALVVKLAFHTMSAGDDLQPGHQKQLAQLSTTLGIPQDQFVELINHLSEPTAEA